MHKYQKTQLKLAQWEDFWSINQSILKQQWPGRAWLLYFSVPISSCVQRCQLGAGVRLSWQSACLCVQSAQHHINKVWWCVPEILALGGQRQEDQKFKLLSTAYGVRNQPGLYDPVTKQTKAPFPFNPQAEKGGCWELVSSFRSNKKLKESAL